MLLRDIAHSRTGDKGNRSTISVIAFDLKDFATIERCITAERVRQSYGDIVKGEDAHGKCLSSAILGMSVE